MNNINSQAFSSSHPDDFICYNTADVAFILDSSGSIRDVDWTALKQFVRDVVGQLTISRQEIHVAAVRYATDTTIAFRLDTSYVKSDIQSRIMAIPKVEGQTNMADAIRVTNYDVFNGVLPGDRPDAPDVIVIISDGRTDNRDLTITQANEAKANGIKIIPVGLDIDGDMELLRSIASNTADVNALRVTSYTELATKIFQLVRRICPQISTGQWLFLAPLLPMTSHLFILMIHVVT